jgi:hypothetical protein
MRPSIKSKLVAVILVTGLSPAVAFGGQVDSRFDGRWVGMEVFRFHNGVFKVKGKVPQKTATLVIAQSGQMFGIVEGAAPGRYNLSEKSHGDTIAIKSPLRDCTFVLSSDGNTIKENGRAVPGGDYGMLGFDVEATFHRVGK